MKLQERNKREREEAHITLVEAILEHGITADAPKRAAASLGMEELRAIAAGVAFSYAVRLQDLEREGFLVHREGKWYTTGYLAGTDLIGALEPVEATELARNAVDPNRNRV